MGVSQAHNLDAPPSHPHPACALPVHLSTVVPLHLLLLGLFLFFIAQPLLMFRTPHT